MSAQSQKTCMTLVTRTDGLFGIMEGKIMKQRRKYGLRRKCAAALLFSLPPEETRLRLKKGGEKMQKSRLHKRLIAWVLTFCLTLPLMLTAQATASPAVQAALGQAVSYYETGRSGKLSDWWELAAVAAAGENLENYALPQPRPCRRIPSPPTTPPFYLASS